MHNKYYKNKQLTKKNGSLLQQKTSLKIHKRKRLEKTKQALIDWKVQDVAELITELKDEEQAIVFRTLQRNKSAAVFSELNPQNQEDLLRKFSKQETKFLLSELDSDDRVALFEELPGEVTRKLFKLLTKEDLKETKKILGYPEESVGRLIELDYVTIYEDMTVEKAIERIRRKGTDTETLNRVYVIDKDKRLLDSIRLRTLVITEKNKKVKELMTYNPVVLNAFDDQEKAVTIMKKYDVLAIPVVDSKGIIIGVVTADDVMDVAEEEATEDIQKIGSVEPLKTSYKQAKIFKLYQKRILWLSLLVIVSLLSSGIIEYYEEVLSATIALAFFIPLLIDTGGNIGSQSATLMIRAIATHDVKMKDWLKVFIKEISIGILIGISLGLLASIIGFFRGGQIIGLIVGITMILIVIVANLLGAIFPFILSKLKIDPAVASAPLITTIMDALGLIIYFTVAAIII